MSMHNLSDNKNIPKNFTKAMFTYAMSQKELMGHVFEGLGVEQGEGEFAEWLKTHKKNIHNIKQVGGVG